MANEYLGAVKIAQSNDQSTILDLSFHSESPELGTDFLNALMKVYDSLNIEDKNKISTNSLNFIKRNLDTLEAQLDNLEGNVRNFRVSNDVFDEEEQSKSYLTNAEAGQTSIDAMDVKIAVANYLQNYINDRKNIHETGSCQYGNRRSCIGRQDQ